MNRITNFDLLSVAGSQWPDSNPGDSPRVTNGFKILMEGTEYPHHFPAGVRLIDW